MDDTTIRPARVTDVPALSDLIQRTVRLSNARDYGAELADLIAANYGPDKVARRLHERDVFVCQKGERIVGTIGLGDGRLRSLFVEPGLQGLGIGVRLVA